MPVLRKSISWMAAALALTALGAGYGYAQDSTVVERSKNSFERLDANKDGSVSLLEYRAARLITFVRMDMSGNERLSLEEYRDYSAAPPNSAPAREAFFPKIDTNKNKSISVKEWNEINLRRFKKWDTDGNKKVSAEEFTR